MKRIDGIKRVLCLLVVCIGFALQIAAQDMAIKTNALGWVSTNFNGGVELRLADRWTAGLNLSYNPWTFSENKKWKHIYASPEVRYWLCSVYAGHFVGFNMMYAHYNAGNIRQPFGLATDLEDERHQGDLWGAGLFYGYSWILSPRWSIEAEVGLGYGYARYKRYDCPKCGTYKGPEEKHMLMPTKAAISVIYNIK